MDHDKGAELLEEFHQTGLEALRKCEAPMTLEDAFSKGFTTAVIASVVLLAQERE